MKPKKDIATLFKENQYKLREQPSPQAWRRLERRLDAHRQRNRFSLYRSLVMVAGVLALVILTALVSIIAGNAPEWISHKNNPPQTMEDLILTDVAHEAYLVVEYTRHYKDQMNNPIVEGEPENKLLPAPVQ